MNENTAKLIKIRYMAAEERLGEALCNLRDELEDVNRIRSNRGIIEPRRFNFLVSYATEVRLQAEALWAFAEVEESEHRAEQAAS